MSTYQPGEIVNVHVTNGRVTRVHDDAIIVAYQSGGFQLVIRHDATEVTIERVTPAEWPPQPGDLWRSTVSGGLVFVRRHVCADRDCRDDVELVDPVVVPAVSIRSADINQARHLIFVRREPAGGAR